MRKVYLFIAIFVTAILADTTTLVEGNDLGSYVNMAIAGLVGVLTAIAIFSKKFLKALDEVKVFKTLIYQVVIGVEMFSKKYAHVLESDIKRDLKEMILNPLDTLLERIADKADALKFKKIAQTLRDVIK